MLPTKSLEAPFARAGTRLSPQYVESPDGRVQKLLQLIDRETGEPCFLSRFASADEEVECRPKAHGVKVFLDAECARPYVETAHGDHQWVSGSQIVRVGALLDPQPAERYIEYSPGQCAPFPSAREWPVYEIDETKTLEPVRGRVVRGDPQARIGVWMFEGEDGSRIPYQLEDQLAQMPCVPQRTEDGPRCAPDTNFELHDEGWLDKNCEQLAILEYGATRIAKVPERNNEVYRFELPPHEQLVELGRRDSMSMCSQEQQNLGRKTLHLGVPYPSREWAELEIHELGDEALGAELALLPSGERAEAEPWIDRVHLFHSNGAGCGPVWTGETLRCLPSPEGPYLWWAAMFADYNCTRRIVAMAREGTVPEHVTITDGSASPEQGTLQTGGVWEVGEPFNGPVYYGSPSECLEQRPMDSNARFFRVGSQVSAELFPELRLVLK